MLVGQLSWTVHTCDTVISYMYVCCTAVYWPRKTPFTQQYWYMCLYLYFFRLQVVIDAFRLINPNMMVLGQESRQTTSNLGHLQKPSIQVSLLKN